MKKSLMIFILALCASVSGYADHSNPTDANIQYIESKAMKKLEHARARVERFKEKLQNSTTEEDIACWTRKVHKAEKKLKKINDSLNTVELLKLQLS